MGSEVSTVNGLHSPADIPIPASLRPVHPFLEDAQRNLWYVKSIVSHGLYSIFNLFVEP
jgi:hypothetical protein